MKLKIVINGNDRRIRITPEDDFDNKLLEILSTAEKASIHKEFESFAYRGEIKFIDLVLDFNKPPTNP